MAEAFFPPRRKNLQRQQAPDARSAGAHAGDAGPTPVASEAGGASTHRSLISRPASAFRGTTLPEQPEAPAEKLPAAPGGVHPPLADAPSSAGIRDIVDDALSRWSLAFEERQEARHKEVLRRTQSALDSSVRQLADVIEQAAAARPDSEPAAGQHSNIDTLAEAIAGHQDAMSRSWDATRRSTLEAVNEQIQRMASQMEERERTRQEMLRQVLSLLEEGRRAAAASQVVASEEGAVRAASSEDDVGPPPPDGTPGEEASRGAAAVPGYLRGLFRSSSHTGGDEPEHTPDRRSRLFAHHCQPHCHCLFETLSAAVIVGNVVYMIYLADTEQATEGGRRGGIHAVLPLLFLIFYSVELAMRTYVLKCGMLLGLERKWTYLDVLTVVVGWAEVIGIFALSGASAFKVLRLLRLIKVFRMSHVLEMSKEVRLVLNCLSLSFELFIGYIVIMLVYLMIFALFFVPVCTSYVVTHQDELSEERLQFYDFNFGTMARGMFTLYSTLIWGTNWTDVYLALNATGFITSNLFLCFIIIYTILVVNVFSSVLVRNVFMLSADAMQDMRHRQTVRDYVESQRLLGMCERTLGSGDSMSYRDFLALMLHHDFRRVFEANRVSLDDTKRMFKLLIRTAGDREPYMWEVCSVNRRQFLEACMRLKREITTTEFVESAVSFQAFATEQQHCLTKLASATTALLEQSAHFSQALEFVRKQVRNG